MRARDDRAERLIARYAAQAQGYRELWAPVLRAAAQGLLRALPDGGVRRVLDLGTGVGTLLPDLQARFAGATVVGVDRTPGMLRLVPPQYRRAVMDATALGFNTGSFDLVLLAFVLFHITDPRLALAEAQRVLRSQGRLATITWGTELESRASRLWSEELDRHRAPPVDELAQHELVDSPEKMTEILERAGFRSPRVWEAPIQHEIGLEHLVQLRTRVGRQQHRFAGLDDAAQRACLASARRRLAALTADDFIAHGSVVYAIATQ